MCLLHNIAKQFFQTISENECYSGFRCSGDNACSGSDDPLYPLAGTSCGSPSDNKVCMTILLKSKLQKVDLDHIAYF